MKTLDRFQRAHLRVALDDIKPITFDDQDRIKTAFVSGSRAKIYQVIIRRDAGITTECLLDTGAGNKNCKGSHSAVCYHALAVLLYSAKNLELEASICQRKIDAELLQRIHGKIYRVESIHAPNNSLWLVVNDPSGEKKRKDKGESSTDYTAVA